MSEIKVVNIKCSGCANTVTRELEKAWIKNIDISFWVNDSAVSRAISFEWDTEKVKKILNDLGYPEVWSKKAESFLKKGKSYLSCAIWKINS